MPEPPVLTDGVIRLRRRVARDVDAIARASHDPQTLRWLEDPPMDEEARRTSLDRVEARWRSGAAAPLVVADAVTDEAQGLVNLQFRSKTVASVAYSVFPEARGRGLAPRAVRLAVAWARTELGVTELLLEADSDNAASIRVAEKCGFEPVGSRPETVAGPPDRTTLVFALRS